MKKPKAVNYLHPLHVRIPLHILNKIERTAIEQNTTMSKVVRQVLEKV